MPAWTTLLEYDPSYTLSALAVVSNVTLNLGFIPVLRQFVAMQSVENQPCSDFFILLMSSYSSWLYAFLHGNTVAIFSSVVNFMLAVLCIVVYRQFDGDRKQFRLWTILSGSLGFIVSVHAFAVVNEPHLHSLIGLESNLITCMQYHAPISRMASALNNGSPVDVPLLQVLSEGSAAIISCLYGYVMWDMYTFLPYVGHVVLAVAQLQLVVLFHFVPTSSSIHRHSGVVAVLPSSGSSDTKNS